MKVEYIMTPRAVTCFGDSSLAEAARMMLDHDCGMLPVVESATRKLCGVITDRDIAMGTMTQGRAAHDIPVRHCCSRHIVTCGPDDDLDVVHQRMRANRVRRLPVVDGNEKVIGVVSLDDLAILACDSIPSGGKDLRVELGRTLGEVCKSQGHHKKSPSELAHEG